MKKLLLVLLLISNTAFAQSIEVYFSPKGGCEENISKQIRNAKKEVLVQAYSFTSFPISDSLIIAKNNGVSIEVILDKSQKNGNDTKIDYVKGYNIPVWIDYKPAIAHNKIMIIDQRIVITGSFNFSASAENKNTENCLIITDYPDITNKYLQNYKYRKSISQEYIKE